LAFFRHFATFFGTFLKSLADEDLITDTVKKMRFGLEAVLTLLESLHHYNQVRIMRKHDKFKAFLLHVDLRNKFPLAGWD
jgi:hypothetical protein